MDASTFLHSVWPSTGYYCIAVMRKFTTDAGKKDWTFDHHVFETIDAAVAFAVKTGKTRDVYVTMLTLKEKSVPNPSLKPNGQPKKDQVRVHRNMRSSRSFFADLDIGEGKDYETRQQGIDALREFLDNTNLPRPSILSSGRGFHLFWLLEEEILVDEWKAAAVKLRALVNYHGFKIDPTRIDDQSSVLRIPGTWHHKDPTNPQPVVMAKPAPATATEHFVSRIEALYAMLPSAATAAAGAMAAGEPIEAEAACTIDELGRACGLVRYAAKNKATQTEPMWFHLTNLLRFVAEPRKWVHWFSDGHPEYTEAGTQEKLEGLMSKTAVIDGIERKMGPATCFKMADAYGTVSPGICGKCWYKGNPQSSPVVAARRMPVKGEEGLPPPPKPYQRTTTGVMILSEDPKVLPKKITASDLYPTMIIDDPITRTKLVTWITDLPLRGKISFDIPIAAVTDAKEIGILCANAGLMVKFNNLPDVRNYMSAYIAELQRFAKDKQQHSHLGWTEDFSGFVLPDVVISATGSVPAMVNDNVATFGKNIKRKGTLAQQIQLLSFYNKPDYLPHQFMVLASLASPLFYMTGHHGVIVNASGESGASKSTSLYTAASMWGPGEDYTINGTNNGATVKARNERVAILANLPICVDEITHMPRDEMKELAMSITQPGHRERLNTKGMIRKTVETEKSTMMLCTSNNSLHDVLSVNNAAGTAGSMRVFEIPFKRLAAHSKGEADDFLRGMKEHYGNVGPAWMEYVTANREMIRNLVIAALREVDEKGGVDAAERFWSAVLAVTLTTARLAYKMGLSPYHPAALADWALGEQLKGMRTTVVASYSDPVDTLMSYIESEAANLLVINQGSQGYNITSAPRGELVGRLETDTRMLFISQYGFKQFCARSGVPMSAMLAQYLKSALATQTKVTLGRGSPAHNFGQTNVIAIDLKHHLISGRKELEVVAPKVVEMKR